MAEDAKGTIAESLSDNNISGGYVSADTYGNTLDVITATSLSFNGIEFKAIWETEGLKIPMVINNGSGNKPFYLRISRDEVVKMVADILDQLSHN